VSAGQGVVVPGGFGEGGLGPGGFGRRVEDADTDDYVVVGG
jgi:hypothetical protein